MELEIITNETTLSLLKHYQDRNKSVELLQANYGPINKIQFHVSDCWDRELLNEFDVAIFKIKFKNGTI